MIRFGKHLARVGTSLLPTVKAGSLFSRLHFGFAGYSSIMQKKCSLFPISLNQSPRAPSPNSSRKKENGSNKTKQSPTSKPIRLPSKSRVPLQVSSQSSSRKPERPSLSENHFSELTQTYPNPQDLHQSQLKPKKHPNQRRLLSLLRPKHQAQLPLHLNLHHRHQNPLRNQSLFLLPLLLLYPQARELRLVSLCLD